MLRNATIVQTCVTG